MRVAAIVFIFVLVPVLASFGLSPTLVLGLTAGGGNYSLSSAGAYTNIGLNETFGWRRGLGPGSYVSLASHASVATYVTSLTGFIDSEAVDAELGLPSGDNTVIFGAGFESSLQNQSGYGSYGLPYWSAEYRFRRDSRGIQPSISYGGRYLVQPSNGNSHFIEQLGFKLDDSSSVRLDGFAEISGAWELWPLQPILNASGAATSSKRQDFRTDLSAGASGLAGFTVDWQAAVGVGLRFSNANEYLNSTSQLVGSSESRCTQSVNFSVIWTPSPTFSTVLSAEAENDAYLSRPALGAGGAPNGTNLDVFSTGGQLKMSVTISGSMYFVVRGDLARTFSNDPSFPQWSIDGRAGIEYSF